ncbi:MULTISPECIES: hypothetical protein [Rhodobacterales]|uniref:Uncharacterized protein n=1 Tax=Jannaschia helgolandensis TaxID=188906 RepID=A0A1H7SWY3_9RHOB|nr:MULTISPECIES: hypothetical protein [Rhodobacterales]SEL76464.1 hypothetical protein SAMN04488526_3472 [Jannaschia helgolandensis]
MNGQDQTTAAQEIAAAIAEASKKVSHSTSVQQSTERLLKATLEALPPPHRIEDTIEIILEEDAQRDK